MLAGMLAFIMISTASMCKKEETGDSPVISATEVLEQRVPLLAGRNNEPSLAVKFSLTAGQEPLVLKSAEVTLAPGSRTAGVASVSVSYQGSAHDPSLDPLLGNAPIEGSGAILKVRRELDTGIHFIRFGFLLKENPDLLTALDVASLRLTFENHVDIVVKPAGHYVWRPALVLRGAGQDNCDTYRIPGLVTTREGTLIAVYDNRYNNSKDLQEDIDVGMSRSTDGGQSWEPMRVIMDLGEWGGRPQRLNGVGDPAVLYDHTTGTIWVAALWISGFNEKDMLWWASKPGMNPDETGQFLLVKSTDDGLTWSDPINITEQIKDPAWQLLFQGPGAGITLADGTLVFAAQFKMDTGSKALDGGQYTCHSTIVYSKDGGQSWHIGTGAKPNTTEAQVVQLSDGGLMLNMRDDLNRRVKDDTNGRAVSVTHDLGQTWTMHPTSNSALQEPNCMASIIGADLTVNGNKQRVLFFSNPNNKNERTNMTIKASLDDGNSWPQALQVELFASAGYGYSCLTMVDENHVGIVYEGVKELFFQKVPVAEIINQGEDR